VYRVWENADLLEGADVLEAVVPFKRYREPEELVVPSRLGAYIHKNGYSIAEIPRL